MFRWWPVVVLSVSACVQSEQPEVSAFEVSGHLEDRRIREASGLARSQLAPGILWVVNDRGSPARVHVMSIAGARLGEFDLTDSRNRDWEDLASFKLGNRPFLMVADIGDNDAKHDYRTLYFVEEPAPGNKGQVHSAWKIDFRYPDGARDAESAAVDIANDRALLLSKRDVPPVLYELPLQDHAGETLVARRIGAVQSLHNPTDEERRQALRFKDWFWQPVGMDISNDNRAAVILTYRAVYYYQRRAGQRWLDALNEMPVRFSLGDFENAEAIAFGDAARTVFVTGENRNSRILRIDLDGAVTE